MDKKSVTFPKEEKIQLPLSVCGAKAAALFSIFGTDKQILFAKQVFEFQDHCVIESYAQYCRNCRSGPLLELCDKQVVSTITLMINSVT